MAEKYRVLTGINYPDGSGGEKRVEAGGTADDLPEKSVKWLLAQGLIEPVKKPARSGGDG